MTSPERTCHVCTSKMVVEVSPRVHRLGKREVRIEDDRHFACPSCGALAYEGTMLAEVQAKIAVRVRQEEGLLTPDELRAIRLKYGFTQAEMENLLNIGPKTWVRWERGKVVQAAAADQLIRVIAKNPEALRDLMHERGIQSDSAERILSELDDRIQGRVEARLRDRFPDMPPDRLREMAAIAAREVRNSLHQSAMEGLAA